MAALRPGAGAKPAPGRYISRRPRNCRSDGNDAARNLRSLRRACLRLGAFERVLPRCTRGRAGEAADRLGLSLRRRAAQLAWAGRASRRGGAAAGRARQQRSLLRMGWPDHGCDRPSCALRGPHSRRADGAIWCKRGGDQRLFPRSGRLTARVHLVSARVTPCGLASR